MLECGRSVFFENKVTNPGKAISQDRKKNKDGWITGEKEEKEKRYNGTRPYKMKTTTHEIGVLSQVKRVKISEALEFHSSPKIIILLKSENSQVFFTPQALPD